MFKFARPVRHHLPVLDSPDPEQLAHSPLFAPLNVGRLQLHERTWIPAMVPWRAEPDGRVSPAVIDWYARFARARPGAIVVEATGIQDIPSGPLLRASSDAFVPGLRSLVRAVRDASGGQTRLFIQLIDFLRIRRRPTPEAFFGRHLVIDDDLRQRIETMAPQLADDAQRRQWLLAANEDQRSAALSKRDWESLCYGAREQVTDLQLTHIRDLPQRLPGLFADAAQRCERAGFDGIELHYAHAYTMASFLSPRNVRNDGYGGSLLDRQRLPLAVLREVRSRLRESTVVGCRILAEECIEGGLELEEARSHATALASAGMDFISLSRGGKFEDAAQPRVGEAAYPYTGRSGWECMPTVRADERGPFGRNLDAGRHIRDALRARGLMTPVIVCGGICTFAQAHALLRDGCGDVVAAARQSLADPDWWHKLRTGAFDEIRRCEYTNYCEALDQRHVEVTCKLWDRVDLDGPNVRRSRDGRRRLVAPDDS